MSLKIRNFERLPYLRLSGCTSLLFKIGLNFVSILLDRSNAFWNLATNTFSDTHRGHILSYFVYYTQTFWLRLNCLQSSLSALKNILLRLRSTTFNLKSFKSWMLQILLYQRFTSQLLIRLVSEGTQWSAGVAGNTHFSFHRFIWTLVVWHVCLLNFFKLVRERVQFQGDAVFFIILELTPFFSWRFSLRRLEA